MTFTERALLMEAVIVFAGLVYLGFIIPMALR